MWTFDDDLGFLEIELESRMKRATLETARRALATDTPPVETGRLEQSGAIVETTAEDSQAQTVIEYSAPYASEVEHGHMSKDGKFVQGKFFLKKALRAQETPLADDVLEHLREMGCRRTNRDY